MKHSTVVADTAMISTVNINALRQELIHYIVVARLGNLSATVFKEMDSGLEREDVKSSA